VTAYPDTSFLVSLYVNDEHSFRANELMTKAELPFLLTPFQELELLNAIYANVFRRKIKPLEAKSSISLFRHDISDGVYYLKPFLSTIFDRGLRLSQKITARAGVRTLDLLHIAAAVEFKARAFYSFDARQKSVAAKLGLAVVPS
jgi:predicted nucleic acid-binding protein